MRVNETPDAEGGFEGGTTIRAKKHKHSRTSICAQRWWEVLQPGRQSRLIALTASSSVRPDTSREVVSPGQFASARVIPLPAGPWRCRRGRSFARSFRRPGSWCLRLLLYHREHHSPTHRLPQPPPRTSART
jgi:hypothetical protein